MRLLVKSHAQRRPVGYLRDWLAAGPKTKGNLKLEVDVDPQSFSRREGSEWCTRPVDFRRPEWMVATVRAKSLPKSAVPL